MRSRFSEHRDKNHGEEFLVRELELVDILARI